MGGPIHLPHESLSRRLVAIVTEFCLSVRTSVPLLLPIPIIMPPRQTYHRNFPDRLAPMAAVGLCNDSTTASGTVKLFPGSRKRAFACCSDALALGESIPASFPVIFLLLCEAPTSSGRSTSALWCLLLACCQSALSSAAQSDIAAFRAQVPLHRRAWR